MVGEVILPTNYADQLRAARGSRFESVSNRNTKVTITEGLGGVIALADVKDGAILYTLGKAVEFWDLADQYRIQRRNKKNSS